MVAQGGIQRVGPGVLPANLTSVQPGGGTIMRLELLWGQVRRWYLRKFRSRYVARMQGLRKGECPDCPHNILDPRDLKYFRNVCGFSFPPQADRFSWRGRLGVARVGLAEIVVFAGLLIAAALLCLRWFPSAAVLPAVLGIFVVAFFRDPDRQVPHHPGLVVSPADGKVDDIEELEYCEPLGGPAVKVGIFLSVFNVHVNRVPESCRVIELKYMRGSFGNAARRASAVRNEQLWMLLEQQRPPYRRMLVKQIAGAAARRIVCEARPGEVLSRGQRFGMIKFGSRMELYLPREDRLCVEVKRKESVRGGSSVIACYSDHE